MTMLLNIYCSVCIVVGFITVVVAVLSCIKFVFVSSKDKPTTASGYDEEESTVNVTPEINLWGSEVFSGPDVGVRKKIHCA